jgi:hypothetical protein
MRNRVVWGLLALTLLALTLVACEGAYVETGSRNSSQQGMNGGQVSAQIGKANGSIERDIEVDGSPDGVAEADVTLSVEKGAFKIELIGRNDEVTLSLEASDGEAVSGHGWMAVDSFGEMSYRLTAVDAENVEYTIEYTFE